MLHGCGRPSRCTRMSGGVPKAAKVFRVILVAGIRCFRGSRGLTFWIMRRRTAFRSASIRAALAVLLSPFVVHAQLPEHLERCLPYLPPRYDIAAQSTEPTIAFDKIAFQGKRPPSREVRKLLLSHIRDHTFWLYPGWTDELAETGLRGVLEERGFFRAEVTAKATILSRNSAHDHVALTVQVDPGQRYRLGTVQFRSVDPDVPLVFPRKELRKQLPIRGGEIFDTSKLRDGLVALARLYSSSGWIDLVPNPNFDINDAAKRIDLVIALDQQVQYRVGEISFLGDNLIAERIVKSILKPGRPFNPSVLSQFHDEGRVPRLPGTPYEFDLSMTKNAARGVVDLQFDFRTCPAFWE